MRYKEELRDKYVYNQDFKHYLSVRENLPAFKKKREIIDILEKTNKLLISGETGSWFLFIFLLDRVSGLMLKL